MARAPLRRLLAVLAALAAVPALPAPADSPPLSVRYYFSPECGSCREFVGSVFPRVEKAVGRRVTLVLRDVTLAGVLEELDAVLAEHQLTLTVLPVLVVGNDVLVGTREVTSGFEPALRKLLGVP